MRISDWSSDVCSSDLKDKVLQRKALGIGESRRPEFGQGSSIRIEIDKNPAAPQFAADGQQSRGRLVQTGELLRLGRSKHSAIQVDRQSAIRAEHTCQMSARLGNQRSEATRVGKQGGRRFRTRWTPDN